MLKPVFINSDIYATTFGKNQKKKGHAFFLNCAQLLQTD